MTPNHSANPGTAKRLAVIGAGPLGIECALYAARLGHDVQLYEAGEIAQHLCGWEHIRMFSPWSMNVSALGLSVLDADGGRGGLFRSAECPTGADFREQYLLPLASSPPLSGRIHTHTRVLGVSRDRLLKSERIGSPSRAERPFRLLIAQPGGEERTVHAERVIDASGVFSKHNWIGSGGLPARGERSLAARIDYGLPDIGAAHTQRFAGERTLVVGSGLSAATSVAALADLARRARGTTTLWLVRASGRDPYAGIRTRRSRTILYAGGRSSCGGRPA
jgi:thioredoxin reductase